MVNKEYLADINYLRTVKGVTFTELSKKLGYSRYWVREQLKAGNEKMYKKAKEKLNEF